MQSPMVPPDEQRGRGQDLLLAKEETAFHRELVRGLRDVLGEGALSLPLATEAVHHDHAAAVLLDE
ncbi:MAG: hypothetical protein KBC28_08525 [Alphaproteobacteria bacterium]|nr:hypothetical protein [Alphaproteobacteria bacterium]